jgi:hypothetical protein
MKEDEMEGVIEHAWKRTEVRTLFDGETLWNETMWKTRVVNGRLILKQMLHKLDGKA